MTNVTHLLPGLFKAVSKVAGSLNSFPACFRERLASGRGGGDQDTHDDGGRKEALEVDLRRVLRIGEGSY